MDVAVERTREVVGEKAAKRIRLEHSRPGEAASSSSSRQSDPTAAMACDGGTGGKGRRRGDEDADRERSINKVRFVKGDAEMGAEIGDHLLVLVVDPVLDDPVELVLSDPPLPAHGALGP